MSVKDYWWHKEGVVFRPKRLNKVAKIIVEAWERGDGVFERVIPPEVEFLPSWIVYGSREHACLLFFWAWLNRYGVKAREVMKKSIPVIEQNPGIFDPMVPVSLEECYVLLDLGLIPFGNNDGRLENWLKNLAFLRENFHGDPREIFLIDWQNGEELVAWLWHNIHGFGVKVSALFVIWFQIVFWQLNDNRFTEEKINSVRLMQVFPPDSQSMRLFRRLDLVVSWRIDHHHALAKAIAAIMAELSKRTGISCRRLTEAFWELMSWTCEKKPDNTQKQAVYCQKNCPLNDYCRYEVKSPELSNKGKIGWDKAVPRKRV